MRKAQFDQFGRRIDCDPVPKKPTVEKVRRVDAMLAKYTSPQAMAAASAAAHQHGLETLEEFNDYSVDDEPIESAPWENPGDETYDEREVIDPAPFAKPDDGEADDDGDPPTDGRRVPASVPGRVADHPGAQVRLPDGRWMLLSDYLAANAV